VLTILHGSDLHFGEPHDTEAAEAFARSIRATSPDLLVLSGDFTQRAKVGEYQDARAFLDRFKDIPTVITPGNHDVPLYRVFERLFAPYRNYREYLSPDLDTVTRVPGATVVALNSAAPHHRIVNGRIRPWQLDFARESFRDAPATDLKVAVIHHHMAPAPDYEVHYPVNGARWIMRTLTEMGVDLILSGHLHRAYMADTRDVVPGIGGGDDVAVAIVHSGTTTSRRGRAREKGRNTCNLIRVHPEHLEVTVLRLEASGEFVPHARRTMPRRPLGSLPEGV